MENAGWQYERPRLQVDTGPLNERAFALKAEIGWIGRNQQLIIPEVGSFVSLALLLLDQELMQVGMQVGTVIHLHQMPRGNQCGGCRKCVEACPAQILGKAEFAANQCLSYLTQSKEVLSKEQVARLDKRLFGCDTCQEVCPHNQSWLKKEESSESTLTRGEDLWRVLNLTKSEFNQRFKSTAAGWRGKGILQRNAYLALKKFEASRLYEWEEERRKDGVPAIIQPYARE
jgi:epoxyqueuosine reductase